MRRNSDEERRGRERGGDLTPIQRLMLAIRYGEEPPLEDPSLIDRVMRGDVNDEQLNFAAALGHPDARRILGPQRSQFFTFERRVDASWSNFHARVQTIRLAADLRTSEGPSRAFYARYGLVILEPSTEIMRGNQMVAETLRDVKAKLRGGRVHSIRFYARVEPLNALIRDFYTAAMPDEERITRAVANLNTVYVNDNERDMDDLTAERVASIVLDLLRYGHRNPRPNETPEWQMLMLGHAVLGTGPFASKP